VDYRPPDPDQQIGAVGSPVSYLVRARLVAAAHIAFSVFAVFGGLLVGVFPILLWPHLAAVFWAAGTLSFDWSCPLTPLEKRLRVQAGVPSYDTGFVQHYFLRTSHSPSETRRVHVLLALALLSFNFFLYRWLGILFGALRILSAGKVQ
jgi:hypothetical protein